MMLTETTLKRPIHCDTEGRSAKKVKTIIMGMENLRQGTLNDFLLSLSQSNVVNGSELKCFFHKYSDIEMEAYGIDVANAVRSRNVERLERLHKQGQIFQCSNRFGESILHMACRQSSYEVVKFLVDQAKVTVRIKDDFGRTPLHDAFFSPSPNSDLVALLIEECPSLLFISDVRGHTPLQYARAEHFEYWKQFLKKHERLIRKGCEEMKNIER